jgi:formate-dependent nitrite reductase membrane component NrfD
MSAAGGTASAGAQPAPPRDSYYGQPVIKEPVWDPEIPWYFFAGGLAGASATLALLSERSHPKLARRAWWTALAGVSVSPPLLIADLGRPARFLNMLRMFKVTSPMSVGSWVLAGSGTTTGVVCVHLLTGRLRGLARISKPVAALLGLPLATYTGALIAQTAVPVWHEARRELPALFGSGAAVSAGAAAAALAPVEEAEPARRLALIGAAAELAMVALMEHNLDELAEVYHEGAAGAYGQLARGLTAGGAMVLAGPGRRWRAASVAGSAMLLAGAVCERWSVFKAGFQSAGDPKYTVQTQRRRIRGGRGHGATRRNGRRPGA